jgi:hypothetical protein
MRPLFFLILAAVTFGQTFEVKDRQRIGLVIISDVKMFQYSSKLDQNAPKFTGILKNV